jgi:hypothetical protein
MTDSAVVTDVPATRHPDGTWAYAVWIRTTDPGSLGSAGVPTDSVRDGQVWARLSLKEVRTVARLASVTAIRADNDPMPRRSPR